MESASRPLDGWQADGLYDALGEREDGKWAASEVARVVPRQNGKGDELQAKALHSLYLTPVKLILWSAHEFKTAREMFLRVTETIEGCRDLSRRVKNVRTSHGEEGVELLDGSRLNFVARSRGSGRGFSPEELLLDEAFALTDEQMAAVMFAVSAQPNPQVWYASSHPLALSTVLRRICRRGRAGSPGLSYREYSADPDAASDDRQAWAEANPGLGIRLTEDSIIRELGATDPDDFRRERLGIVNLDEDAERIIDPDLWKRLIDGSSQVSGPIALSLDMTPDRSWGAIGIVGLRSDGLRHGEVVEHRRGSRWMVDRVVELVGKWDICVVVVDKSSPAAALIPDLVQAGITPDKETDDETLLEAVGPTEMGRACGGWYDAVTAEEWRHIDQKQLNSALAGAKPRDIGDGAWRWSRKDSSIDISPLMVVNLADYGFALYGYQTPDEAPVPFAAWGG